MQTEAFGMFILFSSLFFLFNFFFRTYYFFSTALPSLLLGKTFQVRGEPAESHQCNLSPSSSGFSLPASRRMKVVFPVPFSPNKTTISDSVKSPPSTCSVKLPEANKRGACLFVVVVVFTCLAKRLNLNTNCVPLREPLEPVEA